MKILPDGLDLGQSLVYLTGDALLREKHVRRSLEYFLRLDPRAGLGEHLEFDELIEQSRAKVLLGDVLASEHDAIDQEAADAIQSALDFTAEAQRRGRRLIDGDWGPQEGTESTFVDVRIFREGGPQYAELSEFEQVGEDLAIAWSRLHALSFLTGEFFAESRARFLAIARGEFTLTGDGGMHIHGLDGG